jgi:hypothetical protein
MRLTHRDLRTLEAVQRHWWLPSHYLHEFTKNIAHDMYGHRKSLKRLVEAGYLARPLAINNPMVKNDYLCYALGEQGEKALALLGKKHRYTVPPGGGFAHAAMTVTITANIELAATTAGFRYISQEEILAKAPHETRAAKHPISLPAKISWRFPKGAQHSDRPTTPDQLFGIDYGEGCRFFAVEADRGTEIVEPSDLKANSILRKLLSYRDILNHHAYRKVWGIPNLLVLIVTTSEARVENMLELAAKVIPSGSENILFTHIPGFDVFFRSPPLLPQLWDTPWKRTGHKPFDIGKA